MDLEFFAVFVDASDKATETELETLSLGLKGSFRLFDSPGFGGFG